MSRMPNLLVIGGHDPSGGAGIQADIETAIALGCRAFSVVTSLTAQDAKNVQAIYPQAIEPFTHQLELLLASLQPDAVKIGLLGDASLAGVIGKAIAPLHCPVVLDPVLAAGGGTDLASQAIIKGIREELLPHVSLLTPNLGEAYRLSGETHPSSAVSTLNAMGCDYVLLTGTDATNGDHVPISLYQNDHPSDNFYWPRLPGTYHGSGCTLASACAASLALGQDMLSAVAAAQAYTWQTLKNADQPLPGQHLPHRLPKS